MLHSMYTQTKRHFTQVEDNKLKQLVNEHGQNWPVVAKLMKNRNARQCRERYTKFLSPEINRGHFTREEDNTILDLYNVYGAQWVKIASHLAGRSDASIKARYKLITRKRSNVITDNQTHQVENMQLNFSADDEYNTIDDDMYDVFLTFEVF